jgi:hypothetical protein
MFNCTNSLFRPWPTDHQKSIQPMYISFSVVTKDTYIQSWEKSWMVIGAQSVSKYPHFLCLIYFTNLDCIKGWCLH